MTNLTTETQVGSFYIVELATGERLRVLPSVQTGVPIIFDQDLPFSRVGFSTENPPQGNIDTQSCDQATQACGSSDDVSSP